jgi:very-short-patch-repair endonuclease
LSAPQRKLALHIRAYGLPEPVPEYRFHPERKWRLDFAWPDRKLAVEVEGGVWAADKGRPCQLCGERPKGAHGRGRGILRDIEKGNAAALLGWTLIRVTTRQVDRGEAVLIVRKALHVQEIETTACAAPLVAPAPMTVS